MTPRGNVPCRRVCRAAQAVLAALMLGHIASVAAAQRRDPDAGASQQTGPRAFHDGAAVPALKFSRGEQRTYEYEVRTASDADALVSGARIYGLRCTVRVTVVQRADEALRHGHQDEPVTADGDLAVEAWVLALDVSACRAVHSAGVSHTADGPRPRFVPYPPHERLRTTYAKPFYLVQATDGRVLSVYYPPDENQAALHFKQGVASAFHVNLGPAAQPRTNAAADRPRVLYSSFETDETGVYTAAYECTATGARGSDARRLMGSGSPVAVEDLEVTHVISKHASSDDFVRLADARGSTRELDVTKRALTELDGKAGIVTATTLEFSAVAREQRELAHIRGDYTLSSANTPQNHVSGSMELVHVQTVAEATVAPRRLIVTRADPGGTSHDGATPATTVHVRTTGWADTAVVDDEDTSDPDTAMHVLEEHKRRAAEAAATPPTVMLVKGGLLTRHHATTYTADGELQADISPVDGDDDLPLHQLLECINNPQLSSGAAPRGFSFNARQVRYVGRRQPLLGAPLPCPLVIG